MNLYRATGYGKTFPDLIEEVYYVENSYKLCAEKCEQDGELSAIHKIELIQNDISIGEDEILNERMTRIEDDLKMAKQGDILKTCAGESCEGDCGCDEECWHY